MSYCAVASCNNFEHLDNIFYFYRFPYDPELREVWIEACRRTDWSPTVDSVICSEHFEKDCFNPHFTSGQLFYWAKPTKKLDFKLKRKHRNKGHIIKKCRIVDDKTSSNDDDVIFVNEEFKEDYEKNEGEEHGDDQENCFVVEADQKQIVFVSQQLEVPLGCERYTFSTKRALENIEDIFIDLEENFRMQYEDLECLKCTNVKTRELVDQMTGREEKASSGLRRFALTLNYLSPQAYVYIRSNFNTCLPNIRQLKNWYYSYNGEPGFTKEAFNALKHKADNTPFPILASLIIGEMSIRRCVQICKGKIEGYIDFGTGLEGDCLSEANEVLVFLLTAINNSFKIPVAYFLIDDITAMQRAELVKVCLEKIHETGIKVVALSSKGSLNDIVMAQHLGCSLDDRILTFNHPAHYKVINLFDPFYMVQFLRITFLSHKTFVDKDGNMLKWSYIEELDKITNNNYQKYNLINTLGQTKNFTMHTVKAKLKRHLFSLPVVDAMIYFRNDMKIEKFADCEPTEIFFIIISNVIDVFESISLHHRGFRHALEESDVADILQFVEGSIDYLSTLKDKNGIPITQTSHKNAILGLLGCLEGLKLLLSLLTDTDNKLSRLPLYKITQKQIDLFFSNIRIHCGSENPTSKQFKQAYKSLVQELKTNEGKSGAVVTRFCFLKSKAALDRINETTTSIDVNFNVTKSEIDETEKEIITSLLNVPEYYNEALTYIVAYVIRPLMKNVVCEICASALVSEGANEMLYPSDDVIAICKITESMLRSYKGHSKKDLLMIKKQTEKRKKVLLGEVMRLLIGTEIFDSINYHQLGMFPTSNHVTDLMKAVVQAYSDFRL